MAQPDRCRRKSVQHVRFLDDGRDFSDIFVPNLIGVMQDYGFDGWHAADGMGSGNVLVAGGEAVIRQKLFENFARPIGIGRFPEDLRLIDNNDMQGCFRRSQFIWENYRMEWLEYITNRWITLFTKASDALHGIGRQFMKNICWAKSVFESGYYFGLDMRKFAKDKLDYLMIETACDICGARLWCRLLSRAEPSDLRGRRGANRRSP